MKLTKAIIERCKIGFDFIENNGTTHYLKLQEGNEHYIEFIIEKGNWYYGDKSYVYRESGCFGFTFDKTLFD